MLRDRGRLVTVGLSAGWSDLERFGLDEEYSCSTSWSDILESTREYR